MSAGVTRYKVSDAQAAALRVINLLRGCVERIEEVGSLRRGTADVGDIELLAIPSKYRDLFGDETYNSLAIHDRIMNHGFEIIKGGDKYIQFWMPIKNPLRIKVDLFLTTAEQFGLLQIIRTGPADFSKRLVTSRLMGGMLPAGFCVDGGYLWRQGSRLVTREEEDVFKAIGHEWVSPCERR